MNVQRIKHGAFGGLAGGMLFGVMMGMMGALPMIGRMVGLPSTVGGFFVHMAISAAIGVSFAVLFGRHLNGIRSAVLFGLAYGALWFLLGPLTFMPLMMGMGLQGVAASWSLGTIARMLPSLMGHLAYGGVLGAVYGLLHVRFFRVVLLPWDISPDSRVVEAMSSPETVRTRRSRTVVPRAVAPQPRLRSAHAGLLTQKGR